ncbi:MAG: hypothetical protein AAF654_10430 [Myxococcota bacterium]
MSEQRAVVENGQVRIDVDYPDGTELTVSVEPFLDTESERELRSVLRKSLEDAREGRTVSAESVLEKLG